MDFVELLRIAKNGGLPDSILLEECAKTHPVLSGYSIYLEEHKMDAVYRYIDCKIKNSQNCKANFKANPTAIMKMLLSQLGYSSYTDYLLSCYGSITDLLESAKLAADAVKDSWDNKESLTEESRVTDEGSAVETATRANKLKESIINAECIPDNGADCKDQQRVDVDKNLTAQITVMSPESKETNDDATEVYNKENEEDGGVELKQSLVDILSLCNRIAVALGINSNKDEVGDDFEGALEMLRSTDAEDIKNVIIQEISMYGSASSVASVVTELETLREIAKEKKDEQKG